MRLRHLIQEVTDLMVPSPVEIKDHEIDIIRSAIEQLETQERVPLWMHYGMDMEYRAISEELGVSHTTAWQRARRGIQGLKHNPDSYEQFVAIARRMIQDRPEPVITPPRSANWSLSTTEPVLAAVDRYAEQEHDGNRSKAAEQLLWAGLNELAG